jgi:HPt (histidine-containing phosphotransfer) domain-containing protein
MSTTSPQGQVLVHLDIARALQQIGDDEALRGMLPMLQEMLERDLALIQQRLDDQDVRGANPMLHTLKGCLPIFCTPALCDHVAQVEQMSKAGVGLEVGEAFSLLSPKLRQLQLEVALYLAQA